MILGFFRGLLIVTALLFVLVTAPILLFLVVAL